MIFKDVYMLPFKLHTTISHQADYQFTHLFTVSRMHQKVIFQWIYDYEKAYEIINDSFKMHIPINTNQNRILNIKTENIDDSLSFSFSLTKSFENYLFGVIKQITIGGGNSNNKLHFAMNGGLYNYHVYFDQIYIYKIHITYERSLYFILFFYLFRKFHRLQKSYYETVRGHANGL